MVIKQLQDENEQLKGNTTQLKLQDEIFQDLKQKAKTWETIERKWTKTLFLHKKQKEALDNHVNTMTKEKKKKENVMIDLELINMKNVSLLQFEELRIKIIEEEREQIIKDKECQKTLQHL